MSDAENLSEVTHGDDDSPFNKIALAFILPLIIYLVIVSFCYPDFSKFAEDETDIYLVAAAKQYLWIVGTQVVIAVGLLVYFRKIYLSHFPLRFSWLSVLVGAVGVVLWIGICELHLERTFFSAIGLSSLANVRPAFNPYESLTDPAIRNLFLILRFALLAIIVPIIEELFLRGWLVRWVQNPDFELVTLTGLGFMALLTPSIYGVLTHPSEAIAAFLWFGLVTILMWRTGNLWDCVVAHGVTNLLLGIYVINFEAWHLW